MRILLTPSVQKILVANALKIKNALVLLGVQVLHIILQTKHVLHHALIITTSPLIITNASNVIILVLNAKLKKQWNAMKMNLRGFLLLLEQLLAVKQLQMLLLQQVSQGIPALTVDIMSLFSQSS